MLVAMLGVCMSVLVVWALAAAQSVFAPLAFALFIIAIAWPLLLDRLLPGPQIVSAAS
jgi:hypothetical protein